MVGILIVALHETIEIIQAKKVMICMCIKTKIICALILDHGTTTVSITIDNN